MQVVVSDEDGGESAPRTATVAVANLPPVAIPGGPYSVAQDGAITLAGSGADPGGPDEPLSFAWDFDGDGIFGETVTARGDERGPTPTFSAVGLHAGTVFVLSFRVTDDDGASQTRLSGHIPSLRRTALPWLTRAGRTRSKPAQISTLDASGSFDPDAAAGDEIVDYEWDLQQRRDVRRIDGTRRS